MPHSRVIDFYRHAIRALKDENALLIRTFRAIPSEFHPRDTHGISYLWEQHLAHVVFKACVGTLSRCELSWEVAYPKDPTWESNPFPSDPLQLTGRSSYPTS